MAGFHLRGDEESERAELLAVPYLKAFSTMG
jgi:hypothetical protein